VTRHSFGCLLVLVAIGALAQAQTPAEAKAGINSASPVSQISQVRLGDSAVPLNGPWQFSVGDSPLDAQTGNPLWAEPEFNDSQWETVDLTSPEGSIDPLAGNSGYVPGWTAKGHPGYWGWAWYRIRVQVAARPGQKLAIAGPPNFDDVYQIFENGALVGGFGDFSHAPPTEYYSVPMMFRLPEASADKGATTLVLAFRLWMSPLALATQPDSGGLHSAPMLGDAGAVEAGYRLRWADSVRRQAGAIEQILLFSGVSLLAFSLILFDRTDRVYLWIGAVFLLNASYQFFSVFDSWSQTLSIRSDILMEDCIGTPLLFFCWVMVWWVWFGRPSPRWTPWVAVALALVLSVSQALAGDLFFGIVPESVAGHFEPVLLGTRIVFTALLVWIVVQGIRRQGIEGWLALPAVLLRGIGTFVTQFILLHIKTTYTVAGITIGLQTVTNVLLLVVLSILLLRRLLQSVKRQREMALDVKQAQEVQRVILPEARVLLPGLAIESEYRPAREVGGDFFQIVPNAVDGSVLIVAGDVAGKGMQAGMLVALLVGSIRTVARFSSDPAVMLRELNMRLIGRGDAAATCLAMRIDADGTVTLANSGHLPPYRNGEPVAIEGALPLGMIETAECSRMRFQLEPDDRLVLISDGILEATDAEGKLFGFERIQELLHGRTSAAQLADAAQKFGQDDDISVIAVTRMAAPIPVPISIPVPA
jgi:hypothetical protein